MTHSKHKFLIVFLIVLAILAIWIFISNSKVQVLSSDYKNGTYYIGGKSVTLVDGKNEVSIPDSSSKIVTQYFGNDATGDFNNDGLSDTAFLLTQSTGGSGTFYYLVVALKQYSGWMGTSGVLLGDRIAPQNIVFQDGQIVVNYADRKPNDPMTATPSVGVSKYFKITNGSLVEIKQGTPAQVDHSNLIVLTTPKPNDKVTSPLQIKGQARGYWFFEASFPVELRDGNGNVIIQAPAQATSDWMTESFVPFTLTLKFTQPTTATGTLILRKDNPSGLPEKEDSISIPVFF